MVSGFDDKLLAMIEAHPLIIVGTCDRALVPATSRGFGARVAANRSFLEVLVSHWPSPVSRANIEQTGRIAVTFTAPETYQSFQLKGRDAICQEPTPDDADLADRYGKTLTRRLIAIGAPANPVGLIYMSKHVFRVCFNVDDVFLQTPGKNAGQKL